MFAYISEAVLYGLLSPVDRTIIDRIRVLLPKRLQPSRQRRHNRIDALSHFLVALGDQQMVTSFALLVAAYGHWQDITLYSINVTGKLCLLASTVYTTVLPMLTARDRNISDATNYLEEPRYKKLHGVSKHLRFVLTTCNFLGMSIIFILGEGEYWWPIRGESDLYFLPGVAHFTVSAGFIPVVNYYIFFTFAMGYMDAVICFYSQRIGLVDWFSWRLTRRWGLSGLSSANDLTAMKRTTLPMTRIRSKMLEESHVFHAYTESFIAWQLTSMVFAFVYGTISVWMTRNGPGQADGMVGSSNTWGFGQIVPMVLLLLPFIAILEAHRDYVDATTPKLPQDLDDSTASTSDDSSGPATINNPTAPPIPLSTLSQQIGSAVNSTIDAAVPTASAKGFSTGVSSAHDETGTSSTPAYRPPTKTRTLSWLEQDAAIRTAAASATTINHPPAATQQPSPIKSSTPSPSSTGWGSSPYLSDPWTHTAMFRLLLLITADLTMNTLFAISTALWPLGSSSLARLGLVSFGYMLATGARGLYGQLVETLCLLWLERPSPSPSVAAPSLPTEPASRSWQTAVLWRIAALGRGLCLVVALVMTISTVLTGSEAAWEAAVTAYGSLLAVLVWAFIALVV